jgi:hypothetical protein
VCVDLERDVQVEVVLVLELERHVGRVEEGEAGTVVELEEGMEHAGAGLPAGHRLLDLERVHQREAEEILVEPAGLLGVAAAVGGVVQPGSRVWSASSVVLASAASADACQMYQDSGAFQAVRAPLAEKAAHGIPAAASSTD